MAASLFFFIQGNVTIIDTSGFGDCEQRNVAEEMVCCPSTAFAFVLVVDISNVGALLKEKVYNIMVKKNDFILTCLNTVKQTMILKLMPTYTLIVLLSVLVNFSLLRLKQDYNYDQFNIILFS